MRNKIAKTMLVFCAALVILTGAAMIIVLSSYSAGSQAYNRLQIYISTPPTNPVSVDSYSGPPAPICDTPDLPVVDFDALRKINPDVIGWIHIPGTNIDYPIMHGRDNTYYLRHLMDGSWNRCGSIFMDYRSDPDLADPVTLIHGHNMLNGTMFQDLEKFKSQEFMAEHPYGYILTPSGNYKIQFFAGCLISVSSDLWRIKFIDSRDFLSWINRCIAAASVTGNTMPTETDRIVVLSTCSYEFSDARWMVNGILSPI